MATISTDIRLHFLFEIPNQHGTNPHGSTQQSTHPSPGNPTANTAFGGQDPSKQSSQAVADSYQEGSALKNAALKSAPLESSALEGSALEAGLNTATSIALNFGLDPRKVAIAEQMLDQPSFALDASIPSGVSLLSLLPDLLSLVYEAYPRLQAVDIRWQAVSATGIVLDIAQPVAALGLSHGSTIFIRPYRSVPAPVIRDAAEALAQVAAESQPPNASLPYTCTIGVWGLLALGLVAPWKIPGIALCAIVAGIAAVGFMLTGFKSLLATATVLASAGVLVEIIGTTAQGGFLPPSQRPAVLTWLRGFFINVQSAEATTLGTALALSFALGLVTCAICLGGRMWISHQVAPYLRTCSLLTVFFTGALMMTLAFPLGINLRQSVRECFVGMGLIGVLWAMVIIVLSPMLATKLGRVPITRLPSAGQDLEVSDGMASSAEIQASAYQATAILEGTLCGAAWGLLLSFGIWILATPLDSSGIAIMCLLVIGALLLHAHRHHRSLAIHSLWFSMLAAVLALICSSQGHVVMLVCGGLAAISCALAPWWVRFLRDMAPTTMVWFERLECLCLAVILPLGCYLLDLFTLVRGISL